MNPAFATGPGPETILIVDDQVTNVDILRGLLSNYDLRVALNGQRALRIARQSRKPPDLILLDVMMPDMSGFEVCEQLQADPATRDIPVIFVTAKNSVDDERKGLSLGAVDYITKPISPPLVRARVKVHLDLKRQRDAITEAKQYTEGILESLSDGLVVLSPHGAILTLNRPACDMLGRAEEEMVGRKLMDCFIDWKGTENPFAADRLTRLIHTGRLENTEATLNAGGGQPLEVLVSGSVMRDRTGGVGGIILAIKDISRFKRTQEALRDKEAQLIHAGRLTSLGEMATGIAHEINQPLAIIRMRAQSLQRSLTRGDVPPDKVENTMRILMEQVDRVTTIIDHMRAYSYLERRANPRLTCLGETTRRALGFFREQFRAHQIQFSMDIPERLPLVAIHDNRFEQIVVNFLSNARHAVMERHKTRTGPPMAIAIRLYHDQETDRVCLEVSDNGKGMTPLERERCMEPFFTTKEVGQGTGLGLYIVHGIVTEAQGAIEVLEGPEGGCLFRVAFPPAPPGEPVQETPMDAAFPSDDQTQAVGWERPPAPLLR
ncbi:MAG: response regulator [Magnetococcales bacterium]|nr:response regulator [Magnetococcales bacterium]